MKVNIFYSWQSDLPSNKNRSLIQNCIEVAIKNIVEECPKVTELTLESDSRNEIGTPDLGKSIFEKIDTCDIFIADISIINSGTHKRVMPNPNVMIELGYAAKAVGWSNIICIFNSEWSKVEELPFDIRSRKPIVYNGSLTTKKDLTKIIQSSMNEMLNKRILDKKEYQTTKRNIDVHIQSILIDYCQLLFPTSDRFNYPRLLNYSPEDIRDVLTEQVFLGFYLYRNIVANINEFVSFFNNGIETFFLSDKEKRLIAKMVFAMREYERLLSNEATFNKIGRENKYVTVAGNNIGPDNPPHSYLLMEPIKNSTMVVIAGGKFDGIREENLLNNYRLNNNMIGIFSRCIFEIVTITNDWIKATGNYFVVNMKEYMEQAAEKSSN